MVRIAFDHFGLGMFESGLLRRGIIYTMNQRCRPVFSSWRMKGTRGLTWKLSPVINWIVTLVHDPVSSAAQATSSVSPSLTTVDPSGVVGVTMADARGRRVNKREAIIAG